MASLKSNLAVVRMIMETAYHDLKLSNATSAANARSQYPFLPEDVADILFHKIDPDEVVQFILNDGRVYNTKGNLVSTLKDSAARLRKKPDPA